MVAQKKCIISKIRNCHKFLIFIAMTCTVFIQINHILFLSFRFVGHGSGSQYMPGEVVESGECQAAVFLYGCSSVKLAPRGRVPDPWGVVLNYLTAYW